MRRLKSTPILFLLALCASMAAALAAALSCDTSTNAADDDDNHGDDDSSEDEVKVLSVQPPYGPVEGGTTVAVLGRNFIEQAVVTFGGSAASEVEYISDIEIRCTTPPADAAGPVAVRVTNPDERYGELVDGFRYGGEPVNIDWCNVQWPYEITVHAYFPSGTIYGRVYSEGCTDGQARCDGISGQLGYGPLGVDPSQQPDGFTWIDAEYNPGWPDDPDADGASNDEYTTSIPAQTSEIDLSYVFRFSGDGGATYAYCDVEEGTSDGFSVDDLGLFMVLPELEVGWCGIVTGSETRATTAGVLSEPIYGQIWIDGVTGRNIDSPWVWPQIGVGPTAGQGGDPEADPDDYEWFDADFNPSSLAPEPNSEYMRGLTRDSAGTYGYAYRFSANNGHSWTYCDTGAGSDDGFQPGNMGALTVNP